MTALPFSQACENNKEPILNELKTLLSNSSQVLEVGSGTGQHAVHFARNLPHLVWQCSDQSEYLPGIQARLDYETLANTPAALVLDVRQPWPACDCDVIFSANTLHIMSWETGQQFITNAAQRLPDQGLLCVYGPFNYNGQYTSDSNARFDQWLLQRDPDSAIRDFEAVNAAAERHGLQLIADTAMPANNRLLIWRKQQA